MQYFFDYGFVKDNRWLDGVHKKEKYDDGKVAFARYIEIIYNGKKAEKDLKEAGTLPDGNRFLCTLDIYYNGEYRMDACLKFAKDALDVLKNMP